MKPFRKIQTTDTDLVKVQSAIEQTVNPIVKLPILDGILLTDLQITTSAQKFNHQLTRKPQGYIIVNKNAAGDIYSPASTATTITLQSTANCTVSLWVF